MPDIDDMAAMYDDKVNNVLDQLIPFQPISRRRRPSDPWFDAECRAAKRLTLLLHGTCVCCRSSTPYHYCYVNLIRRQQRVTHRRRLPRQ